MAHVDGAGKRFVPSSRKYDRTIEDALQTMERLASWLDDASETNVWTEVRDPLQMAVLHGMLTHLSNKCGALVNMATPEVLETVSRLRAIGAQPTEAD